MATARNTNYSPSNTYYTSILDRGEDKEGSAIMSVGCGPRTGAAYATYLTFGVQESSNGSTWTNVGSDSYSVSGGSAGGTKVGTAKTLSKRFVRGYISVSGDNTSYTNFDIAATY